MAKMASRGYAIHGLEYIAEKAEQLTTGNVKILGAIIKCKAEDSVQYLKRFGDPNDEVLHKAMKRLKWVAKDCSELHTGNVAHRRPVLVYFSRRMAEYIKQHIND